MDNSVDSSPPLPPSPSPPSSETQVCNDHEHGRDAEDQGDDDEALRSPSSTSPFLSAPSSPIVDISPPPAHTLSNASRSINSILDKLTIISAWFDSLDYFVPFRNIKLALLRAVDRLRVWDASLSSLIMHEDEWESLQDYLEFRLYRKTCRLHEHLEPFLPREDTPSDAPPEWPSDDVIFDTLLPIQGRGLDTLIPSVTRALEELSKFIEHYGKPPSDRTEPPPRLSHHHQRRPRRRFETLRVQSNHCAVFSEIAERIISSEQLDVHLVTHAEVAALGNTFLKHDNKIASWVARLPQNPDDSDEGDDQEGDEDSDDEDDGPLLEAIDELDTLFDANYFNAIPTDSSSSSSTTTTSPNETAHDTLALIRLFQTPGQVYSLPAVAWIVGTLAIHIFKMELYDEAAAFAIWAARIYSDICSWLAFPSNTTSTTPTARRRNAFQQHYALALLNAARCELKVSNAEEAMANIDDCIKVCTQWVRLEEGPYGYAGPGGPVVPNFRARYMLSRATVTASARLGPEKGEYRRALELAETAVEGYEIILNLFERLRGMVCNGGREATRWVVYAEPESEDEGEAEKADGNKVEGDTDKGDGKGEAKRKKIPRTDFSLAPSSSVLRYRDSTCTSESQPRNLSGIHRLVYHYARALRQASYAHHDMDDLAQAAHYQRRALHSLLSVQRAQLKLLEQQTNIPPNTPFPFPHLDTIAESHYHLTQPIFRPHVHPQDIALHGKEAIAYYSELVYTTGLKGFGLGLYNSYWEYASFVVSSAASGSGWTNQEGFKDEEDWKQHQYTLSLSAWRSMAQVAQDCMLDPLYTGDAYRQMAWTLRRMKKHLDAIRCREISVEIYGRCLTRRNGGGDNGSGWYHEADGLQDLSVEYHMAERFQESLWAAMRAVASYRVLAAQADADAVALAMSHPTSTQKLMRRKLGEGLSQLTFCHVNMGNIEQSIVHAQESMDIFKAFPMEEDDEAIVPVYLYSLRVCINAAFQYDDAERSLAMSLECVDEFRRIFAKFPGKAGCREALSGGLSTHGFNLNKHQRAHEAIAWSEASLDWYADQPLHDAREVNVTDTYIATLINLADDLANVGRLSDAKRRILQAIHVGETYCADKPSSVPFIICALHNLPEIHLDFGEYEEALRTSVVAVEYAEGHRAEDETQLSGALMVQGTVLARMGRLDEGVALAEESLRVCQRAPLGKIAKTNMFAPLQYVRAYRGLAEMYADRGEMGRALECAKEGWDRCVVMRQGARKGFVLPVAFSDVVFNYCRYTLCEVKASVGLGVGDDGGLVDLNEVGKAYGELKVLAEQQRKIAMMKPGNYPRLAPVLHLLAGLACGALGEHEEGIKYKTELDELKQMLSSKAELGEVGKLLEIELDKEARRANQKRLWEQLDLQCGHLG